MVEFEQKRAAREQCDEKMVYCSFCGKSQQEANQIIAGSNVFICDDCARLCVEIIDDQEGKLQQQPPTAKEGGTAT